MAEHASERMNPPPDRRGTVEPLSPAQRIVLLAGLIGAVAAGPWAWRTGGRLGGGAAADGCSYRTYDATTGELRLLACDTDRNGKVDLWLVIEASGRHTIERDVNEDGLIDRAEVYGTNQELVLIAYDRRPDGSYTRIERVEKPDASGARPETR